MSILNNNSVVWFVASKGGNSSQMGTECVEHGEKLSEEVKNCHKTVWFYAT